MLYNTLSHSIQQAIDSYTSYSYYSLQLYKLYLLLSIAIQAIESYISYSYYSLQPYKLQKIIQAIAIILYSYTSYRQLYKLQLLLFIAIQAIESYTSYIYYSIQLYKLQRVMCLYTHGVCDSTTITWVSRAASKSLNPSQISSSSSPAKCMFSIAHQVATTGMKRLINVIITVYFLHVSRHYIVISLIEKSKYLIQFIVYMNLEEAKIVKM